MESGDIVKPPIAQVEKVVALGCFAWGSVVDNAQAMAALPEMDDNTRTALYIGLGVLAAEAVVTVWYTFWNPRKK